MLAPQNVLACKSGSLQELGFIGKGTIFSALKYIYLPKAIVKLNILQTCPEQHLRKFFSRYHLIFTCYAFMIFQMNSWSVLNSKNAIY